MSKAWIRAKRPAFVRDVLRDFCLASLKLEEQFRHNDQHKRLNFDEIRDLLGFEMNKGLLWRLKDTAHHLFRNEPGERLVGRFLDWSMGYIFHETIKLKEDAYQQATYGQWFRQMQGTAMATEESDITRELYKVVEQTRESIEREIARIRFILAHCRRLFPLYLCEHKDNLLLARLIFEEQGLVEETFGNDFARLQRAIYGGEPELMYVYASRSLRQGGWMEDAARAVEEAARLCNSSPLVLQEKEIVDSWQKKLKV
jgi:hypothetical protein